MVLGPIVGHNLDLASGPTGWLATYDNGYDKIDAVRISPSGIPLDSTPIVVSAGTSSWSRSNHGAVFATGSWLVCWGDGETREIRCGRLSTDGVPIDGNSGFSVAPIVGESLPAIASDGTTSLLVWSNYSAQTWDSTGSLFAARVSNGAVLDSPPRRIVIGRPVAHLPSLAWNDGTWLLAWQESDEMGQNGGDGDIFAARLASDGSLLDGVPEFAGIPVARTAVAEQTPSVCAAGNGHGLIAFASGGFDPAYSYEPQILLARFEPCPMTLVAPPAAAICEGDRLELPAILAANSPTLSWTRNGTPISDGGRVSGATTSRLVVDPALPADSGTYSLTVSDSCPSSGSVSIPVDIQPLPPTPVVTRTSGAATSCWGDPVTFEASEICTQYKWSFGPTSRTITDAPLWTTTYTVRCTTSRCSGAPASITQTVKPRPESTTAWADPVSCTGETLRLHAATLAGATYRWSGPNGFASTDQDPVIPGTTLAANGYYLVYTVANGCESWSPTGVPVNLIDPPAAPAAGNNGPVCTPSSLQLSASTVPGATYSWTGPNGFASASQNPIIAGATSINAGTYTVIARIGFCSGAPAQTVALVQDLPAFSKQPQSQTVCSGTPAIFSVVAAAGTSSYQWYKGATAISGATSATYRIASAKLLDSGTTYKCRISGPCGALTSTTATLNVASVPPGTVDSVLAARNGPSIGLSWTEISGASSYKVYRDVVASGGFTTLVTSVAAGSSGTTVATTGSVVEYYRIAGSSPCGDGPK